MTAPPDNGPVCRAPYINLHFLPDGEARACSRSMLSLGNVRNRSVREIWEGAWRTELVRRLSVGDLSAGCQSCSAEFDTLGRTGSIASEFDAGPGGSSLLDPPPEWPLRMDFMLSNTCNLQCVQCHGAFSSAIRRHRERRPPLISPYGEQFVDELAEFLPNLSGAQFAGGEPFLVPVNYRIWSLIEEVAPDLECFIITNGTRWSDRIEAALAGLRAHVLVSMDGISTVGYESIRVGASLDQVLRNLDRFAKHAEAAGTSLSLNFCLMQQNYQEFGPMCRFAESRGLRLNVLIVREPREFAIPSLAPEDLRHVVAELEQESERLAPSLVLNRSVWELQLERLRRLRDAATTGESVVMFRTVARPRRSNDPGARPERAAGSDLEVYSAEVTPRSLVHQPDSLLAPLPGEVLAQAIAALGGDVERLGELVGHEPLEVSEDLYRARVLLDGGSGEVVLHVERDPLGRAVVVRVTLSVEGMATDAASPPSSVAP